MANQQSLPVLLKELRLPAIAKAWAGLAQKASSENWEPELFLAELCELEANDRYEKRLQGLLRDSKLLTGKQLSQYNFSQITGVTQQQLKRKTQSLDWVRQGHNLLIFGASDLGKTHLAAALGFSLIEQSIKVKFSSSTALVQQLQVAREALDLEGALKKLEKYELLILDDIVT